MHEKYTLVAGEVRDDGVAISVAVSEAVRDTTKRRRLEELVKWANEGRRRALYDTPGESRD